MEKSKNLTRQICPIVIMEIMLNAPVKLHQGKLVVIGLMFMTKYSYCCNRLMLFCLHAHMCSDAMYPIACFGWQTEAYLLIN